MSVWQIINSPFVITFVSFVLGGIIASIISAAFQNRSRRHSAQLLLCQDVLKLYHNYLRFIKRRDNCDSQDEFDQMHAEMLSKCGMAKILFGAEIGNDLARLADYFATIHDLKKQAQTSGRAKIERAYVRNLQEAYSNGRLIIEKIFIILK